MNNSQTFKHSKYIKLLDEQLYETKSVKVIVRFFEKDMILLVVMRKSDNVNEEVNYNHNSQSAYFSAFEGNIWYAQTRDSLLNFKEAAKWFKKMMVIRFPEFFDPDLNYIDNSMDSYNAVSHNRKCIADINKWYENGEYKTLLELFPDADPTVHDYCNIEYSFPWSEFHISTSKLPNPYVLPHPEPQFLPYNQLTIAYPIRIDDQNKIIDFFKIVDKKAYQMLLQVTTGKDIFIELFINWIKDYQFRVVCQVFSNECETHISLIEDNLSEYEI